MGIFFDGGGGDDFVKMGNELPGQFMRSFRLILSGMKPAIRDVQKVRKHYAMMRETQKMQQQVLPPEAPTQNPASISLSVATPDLAPPPRRT